MKRLFAPLLNRLARSLGVTELQKRLDSLEDSPIISPDLYIKLENRFRGDPALISERQSQYLEKIKSSVSAEAPLLDVGCGRGEWLHLLKKHNFPARGIDSNPQAVKLCRQLGLDVTQRDIIQELDSLESSSIGAITFFQVFEHLPFPLLLEVLKKSKTALAPQGVLIAEIPNIETLRVGAATFWIDPTHERPLFPDVLEFLAREAGYSSVESVYSTPLEETPNLDGVDEKTASVLASLHQRINGNGDFAIIARP